MADATTEDRALEKVRKLLERANHENTPAGERESCLEMADRIMAKHSLDQALLETAMSRDERRKPVVHPMPNAVPLSTWRVKFRTMLTELARTNRTRYIPGKGVLVGMQEDVTYVEMVWASIQIDFMRKLEPGWSDHYDLDGNVYNLVVSGTKWADIASLARSHGHDIPWPDGGRLKRAYVRDCKRRGLEPAKHTQRNAAYRESFAEGYVRQVCRRLEDARREARGEALGSGAELVLSDRRDDIEDLVFQQFGYDDKADYDKQVAEINERLEREEQERREAEERRRASLTEAQRAREDRLAEAERQREARLNDRYWRQKERESDRNYDQRGMANGRAAGDAVSLSKQTEATDGARKAIG